MTACELLVGPTLALHSFRNRPHLLLFAACFVVARAQFRPSGADRRARWRAGAAALAISLAVGALLQVAQGVSGAGHCRLRDLLPDAAGALLGWATLGMLMAVHSRWRPGRTDGRAAA